MRKSSSQMLLILVAGAFMGLSGVFLSRWGNPVNSGICVSCFLENLAGSLHLTGNARMSYFRPELAGFVLGALLSALAAREMKPTAGRMPVLAFILGFLLIAGSSVFMGCPIKMILRLSAGDLTAVAGIFGLAAGIWAAVRFVRAGVDVGIGGGAGGEGEGGTGRGAGSFQGLLFPLLLLGLFALFLALPGLLRTSIVGPGAQHAPLLLSLGAGTLLGALAQRSRFCVTGGFTNLFLARDSALLAGLGVFLASAIALHLALGTFRPGLLDQPGSHPDHLWNFLGMALTGFAAVLAGGCPFRQLVLTGEGKVDAAVVALGMLAGGVLVQRWGIASTSAGPTPAGKTAVLAGLLFCFLVVRFHRKEV